MIPQFCFGVFLLVTVFYIQKQEEGLVLVSKTVCKVGRKKPNKKDGFFHCFDNLVLSTVFQLINGGFYFCRLNRLLARFCKNHHLI
jgi:hypothetical protein